MKKILLFILSLLFYLPLAAQISENEFPIIGYFDHYVHERYSSYYGVGPNLDNFDWAAYYQKLEELGLTHLVTMGDDIPLNNGQGIEIIDNNILYGIGGVKIGDYAQAQGNEPTSFAYEVGGSNPASIWSEDKITENYGFGGNTGYYSKWIKTSQSTTGNQNYRDTEEPGQPYVAYADTTTDNQGILVSAEFPSVHHFKNWNYYVMLVARIDPIPGGNPNDIVAKINIDVTTTSVVTGQNHTFDFMPSGTPDSANYIQTESFDVKASEFDGNNYTEIVKGTFGAGNKILKMEIEWMDKRNLYVDQICVYDTFYRNLFVEPTSIQDQIQTQFTNYSAKDHANHEHFYIDEPTPIMYRAYNIVSTIAENSAQGKYINSATGSRFRHDAIFANSQRRLPYVLYDFYTIEDDYDSSSTGYKNIQDAFDRLIYSGGGPEDGSNRGLRTGIEWAQGLSGSDSPVPFYMTIQVQAENYVDDGQIDIPIYRAPRPNEILAEGNLSICYGAKGIMYFIIGTFTPNATDSTRAYYGLFDDTLNVYDGTNGIIQDPKHDQVPNERYHAVKRLNQHINNISSTLLDLTWLSAYSIHNGQPTGEYVTNIQSYNGSAPDPSAENFVELGLFENTNNHDDYFYVVNRRVLSTESRDIKINLNMAGKNYPWLVEEIGTQNSWSVNTGDFTTNFEPGEGKLFKLSTDQSAPSKPQGLSVVNSSTFSFQGDYSASSSLTWFGNEENDLDYYRIYKAVTTGAEPSLIDYSLVEDNITDTTITITLSDVGDNKKIYYRITAVDTDGNESVKSEESWDWAPPSPPSNIQKLTQNDHPKIKWDAKTNLTSPEYMVHRMQRGLIPGFWNPIATTTNTSYVDEEIDLPDQHSINMDRIYYKVTVSRNGSQPSSNYSSSISYKIEGSGWTIKKEGTGDAIPEIFALEQNYPNPFNPTTVIKYQLPEAVNVTIKLYDMLGQELQEILNKTQEAGYYELTIDGSDLSSGTYIYRITAGDFTDSKKLLLLK